ncbi:hypothetical protein [Azospirillum ramasamyi]|uniref:hypothetical protein n=1 Tax=Azospirillum ramasamyi TaxID=682998 RepID=UPI0013A6AF22|nr:hypothetical protein [Azospirillum ramasamyi]
MDNLLTLLGEARAHVNIYSTKPKPSERTADSYKAAFESYLKGGHRSPAAAATTIWRRAAIRHGAIRQLRGAVTGLEQALSAGDAAAAAAYAAPVRAALDLLYSHMAGRRARRPRGPTNPRQAGDPA